MLINNQNNILKQENEISECEWIPLNEASSKLSNYSMMNRRIINIWSKQKLFIFL